MTKSESGGLSSQGWRSAEVWKGMVIQSGIRRKLSQEVERWPKQETEK